ncbi:MAG: endolytic transglycosylase MltG [Betaproteobacteria bacterium]|nr:endolytic transglycosylase MltG [Betaproteobacteria bacterium]NDA92952.1 endolytic transglycosylase MltG [Betaproteobacteria bacterium]NDE93617.1 endolytic transglycosylase MltG [Betaproteobacteria bacterium]
MVEIIKTRLRWVRHVPFSRRVVAVFAAFVFLAGALSYLEFRLMRLDRAMLLAAGKTPEVVVERGYGLKQVIDLVTARAWSPSGLHWIWARIHLASRLIKAGVYPIDAGLGLPGLLDRMALDQGKRLEWQVLEGQSLEQVRRSLAALPYLRKESAAWSQTELQAKLKARLGEAYRMNFLEGMIFPDKYRYVPGMSDLELLAQACLRQHRLLDSVWAQRPATYPLRSQAELMVLASLVEKETGDAADRSRVAAVFLNRLGLGMRLQSDPTVIYGLGMLEKGRLTRKDLETDHPYNTYTRYGLPPAPIAIPGEASLLASIRPSQEASLYFVARGDGSSEFSTTLAQHNLAVDRYIRKRMP